MVGNQKKLCFIDAEVGIEDHNVHDIGALGEDGSVFHSASGRMLTTFLNGYSFVCGHNIVHHDLQYLASFIPSGIEFVDTLYMSPLLFPKRPYHNLVKDDKLLTEELNNPVNDCQKAQSLFYDEVSAFKQLPEDLKQVFGKLLADKDEFKGFFRYIGFQPDPLGVTDQIRKALAGHLCENADIEWLVDHRPCELAYTLALVQTEDVLSVTPPWVLHNFPFVERVMQQLRHTYCKEGCNYCRSRLDIHSGLKTWFNYEQFRTYDGEPMQAQAVQAAVDGDSLLAIFPTGGGKSLTFQLPALMEGQTVHGLTVVISPLQSLMKDQVDNLAERGITSAVTINGLLDPITRADAITRVEEGSATLLYISPEMLRSRTIEHLLMKRHVVRFVVDEAHCFSAWGQDFRVDYLYIGDFIAKLQAKKNRQRPIPVSCFTATAKQKVVTDICDYFERTLGLKLRIFASSSARHNLQYSVIHVDSDEEKYAKLRSLISDTEGPKIVYVSRTKRTKELAQKLTRDGMRALPFNGKMDANEKIANQNAFMSGEVPTIVATSAFGMGVDKKDVGLVVHYDISDSLENYVQEAGRAGRDPSMQAKCYVLYGDQDLDKHFVLLNQTKLSMSEIQQVWKAIKTLTKQNKHACCSALEIARQAGWDDSVNDIETRVRTAVSALEQAGYLERGNNVPRVYATGIMVKNMEEARMRLNDSPYFDDQSREAAARIIKSLITCKNISKSQDGEAESRIDYLADILGLTKTEVISAVEHMRQEGILADSRDMQALLTDDDTQKRSRTTMDRYVRLEQFLIDAIPDEGLSTTMRQLNDQAVKEGLHFSTVKSLLNLIYFLVVKGYLIKETRGDAVGLKMCHPRDTMRAKFQRRALLSRFLIDQLFELSQHRTAAEGPRKPITFSLVEMLQRYQTQQQSGFFAEIDQVSLTDVEEAFLYLSKIGSVRLEGGFLVLYNAMEITRKKDAKFQYKQDDYRLLNEFYKQKIQQVHIVGEYANLMVKDYDEALQYVQDYFGMDHKKFISKYFKGERAAELEMNITPDKYAQLFGNLSARQRQIIDDKESRYIVVAAGPGSGKTRVLVHKMASLLLMEEVKHEQLLMLTFSRSAAIEFKKRLLDLIGNAAHFVEIKTFHSYCFDLLGRIGNLDDAKDVVQRAATMISQGEVEPNKISKTVLVIDEAQDMDEHEYALVRALMAANEEMRVVAVGDDDQNVYQFRGSDSRYMQQLVTEMGAKLYELTDNYRSAASIVALSNMFAQSIRGRMKVNPITAVMPDEGHVEVVQHCSNRMEQPIVNHISRTILDGTTCVLTDTNEEAMRIVALLRHHHIPCRMIQSMDGFCFIDLAEVRYFLRTIELHISSPVITDDLWNHAKDSLLQAYRRSECMENVALAISDFERTNRTRYLSDLREFFFESSIEDFCPLGRKEVVVSTVHKAKGREFDSVFLYVTDRRAWTDDTKRQWYVGITRAKKNLFIHTADSCFASMKVKNYTYDPVQYLQPEEITVELTHKDVFLDFFKDRKRTILSLRSGDSLRFDNNILYSLEGIPVAKLSNKQCQELAVWKGKGYHVISSKVNYIVAWRPKDADAENPEVAVLLAELRLGINLS